MSNAGNLRENQLRSNCALLYIPPGCTVRPVYPKNAIREAVYNALAHKNYADETPIQISVYEDKLYIANGCTFPKDWTEKTLFQKHSSRAFYPNIAGAFFRVGYVEAWGRGIEKMCEACVKHGIPKPKYTKIRR